jgi:UPF0716 protein FxsA
MLRILLLLAVVPLTDILLLVWMGQQTDGFVVMMLIVVPAVLGLWVARHIGLRALREVNRQMALGRMPSGSLLDGLLMLLAGGLLIFPGPITDLAGLGLLVPPLRRAVRKYVVDRIQTKVAAMMAGDRDPMGPRDKIIDVRVIDPPSKPGQRSDRGGG